MPDANSGLEGWNVQAFMSERDRKWSTRSPSCIRRLGSHRI